MEQDNSITNRKKHKHILQSDRYVIERMLRAKQSMASIVATIGCTPKTLRREIKRGTVEQRDSEWRVQAVYFADAGQAVHEKNAANKGRYSKLNDAPDLRSFLETQIKTHNFSPAAALMEAKNRGYVVEISVKTLYNAIDSGAINVSRNDLLRKDGWKKNKSKPRILSHKNLRGASIESRPETANDRSEYGHWEKDLLVSCKGGKGALLTLTERMTRQELIIRLPDKTQRAVKRALDRLERRYGSKFKETFKTMTTDNGSEFLDFESLERSCKREEKRFKMYFAHPYSSWERGSNENANGIIRRFFPKGTDFSKIGLAKIQAVEDWMNNYPRRILGGISANAAVEKAAA